MQIINDNAVTTNGVKREGVLTFVYDGSCYCAKEVAGNNTKFEKYSKPRNFCSLYMPEEYGLINRFNNDSKWDSLVEKYLKSEKKLGIDLKKTISVRNSEGKLIQQENVWNSHKRNSMMQYCYNWLVKKANKRSKSLQRNTWNFN
ncbi:hypothetical protein A6V39_03630 [Candidatus Mycoplasma haematobovis]|uniref:Uncharacterized protein n=1 Tax=Candidatus Mycoplasma haematobovis TaxID=432608 RepID=A0A1A9QBY8_9MOLU|nr:hypothetical protein [Candidatus Mycoplasma haematobovis]OAL09977.1 hypothetical protein A6V39_03630 [Candidatus Mycoplasma haematobovis]